MNCIINKYSEIIYDEPIKDILEIIFGKTFYASELSIYTVATFTIALKHKSKSYNDVINYLNKLCTCLK